MAGKTLTDPSGVELEPPVERLREILDSISEGVFSVDGEWRITSFNRAASNLLGIPPEEAMGRICKEVLRADICEDDCALRYTRETGLPITNFQVRLTTLEGRRIPVSVSTSLLRDRGGRVVGAVETIRDLSREERLRQEIREKYTLHDFVTRSPEIRKLFSVLPTIARSDSTVLIQGETGTGKELVARAIHDLSLRRNKPLVVVNCGALPDSLLESELFGYEAGAFTDARKAKAGRIAQAEGGTLFLDEVGEMSKALQVKLLRVLQERTYEKLGAVTSSRADVRYVAATHHDLSSEVERGAFREDLYYRLNVIPILLPPLRERKGDIPLLVGELLARLSARLGKEVDSVEPRVLALLMDHSFPGNVRELLSVLEHAAVLCSGGIVRVEHLPASWHQRKPPPQGVLADCVSTEEARLIRETLEVHGWHREATARALGIHKTTLYRKIERLGIVLPGADGRSRGRRDQP